MSRSLPSSSRVLSLALLGGLCLSLPAQSPRRVFGDPSTPQYAPNRTYHVENYKVAARINMEKGEIAGDETVTLHPLVPSLKQLYLNSAQLTIDAVSLQTSKGSTPLTFHSDESKLWITLDQPYTPEATLNLRITYHGNPQGRPFPDAGLSFIRPDASNPKRPLEVWSYGWPENNHFWFPCWDYPNDKATSETIITVPEPLSVVSNGELVKETHSKGEATFDWVEHVPHSVYLVSIAVGPWTKYSQTYKTKSVDYYVPPGTDRETALRSFGLTPDMMVFYASTYGVDYPYEKYAQTADHAFGGGTENISATSLAETTLHDARAEQDYPSFDLVSHELAHQWFGDLITEWSWDSAWLSEGFATFSAALYRGHHLGDDAYRYQIWQDQQTAAREDATRYRRPIVDRHYTRPWEILDRTTYQKGSVILDMLRYIMNDQVEESPSPSQPFFQTLRNYLTAYYAKNVETHNLINMFRTTTGRELDWFFDEWVFKAGYPQYTVHTSYDAAKHNENVTVLQTQKVDEVTPLFDMPVVLHFYSADGKLHEAKIRVRQKEETFAIPLDFEPQWMDFDPYNHIYKTLTLDEPIESLIARGEKDKSMISRLWAAQQLGKATGASTDAAVKALSQILEQDAFYAVRMMSAQSLGALGTESAKQSLLNALKQPNSHVRTAVVEALGHFSKDSQVYSVLVEVLRSDDSYAAEAAAARNLGELGTEAAFTVLQEKLATNPSVYVATGLIQGIAHYKTPQAKALLTEQSKTGITDEVRQLASRSLQGGGTGRNR